MASLDGADDHIGEVSHNVVLIGSKGVTENVRHRVVKAIATNDKTLIGNADILIKVGLGHSLVLRQTYYVSKKKVRLNNSKRCKLTIVEGLGNLE